MTQQQLVLFRVCITCGEAKELDAFVPDKTKPSGYRGRCRDCQRAIDRQRVRPSSAERQRAFYARHPEKRREYQQRWKEKDPERARASNRESWRRWKERKQAEQDDK